MTGCRGRLNCVNFDRRGPVWPVCATRLASTCAIEPDSNARHVFQIKRVGYDDHQAQTILVAARDADQPHRRWIPWVCAFTGCRLDEVAGRNARDIQRIGPVWILDIEIKPGGKITQPLPKGWNAFAYTLEGTANFGTGEGQKSVEQYHNVVFEQEGDVIQASVPDTHLEFFRNCTPGYYNNDGDLDDIHRLGANNFLAGSVVFYDIIRSWRASGELAGLEVS